MPWCSWCCKLATERGGNEGQGGRQTDRNANTKAGGKERGEREADRQTDSKRQAETETQKATHREVGGTDRGRQRYAYICKLTNYSTAYTNNITYLSNTLITYFTNTARFK